MSPEEGLRIASIQAGDDDIPQGWVKKVPATMMDVEIGEIYVYSDGTGIIVLDEEIPPTYSPSTLFKYGFAKVMEQRKIEGEAL